MLTPTHALTASTLFLTFGGTCPVAALVGIVSALAPDLDSRQSIAGRLVPVLSKPIEHHFGHRTITHSLLLQLSLCYLAYLLFPNQYALAITCGLVSHSMIDMLTKSGVCWFWPSRVRCVLPGSSKYRFEVGGKGELVFAAVMVAAGFGAVALHKTTAGTGGMIRAAIGDIGAARSQYDEQKGSEAFLLRLKGRDNTTFEEITGEYPVIAAWASSGLLIDDNGQARTVCGGECEWHPEHAVLVSVGVQATTIREITVPSVDSKSLRLALATLDTVGELYVTGNATGDVLERGVVVQKNSGTAKFYYAGIDALPASGVLRDVELTVQIRHEPGVVVPELVLPKVEPKARGIDPRLQKWLE